MPSKPKPKQSGVLWVIKPDKKAKGRVLTYKEARKEQLKKNKKPSKGSTGYSGATRT